MIADHPFAADVHALLVSLHAVESGFYKLTAERPRIELRVSRQLFVAILSCYPARLVDPWAPSAELPGVTLINNGDMKP